jgi:hypothetical protein
MRTWNVNRSAILIPLNSEENADLFSICCMQIWWYIPWLWCCCTQTFEILLEFGWYCKSSFERFQFQWCCISIWKTEVTVLFCHLLCNYFPCFFYSLDISNHVPCIYALQIRHWFWSVTCLRSLVLFS